MSTKQTLPCAAVRDLLPLDADGLCSPDTHQLITEHLETCTPCTQARDALTKDITAPDRQDDTPPAGEALAAVRKSYRSIRVRTLIITIAIALALVLGLSAFNRWLKQDMIPLSAQEMDATTLFVSETGLVYYRLGTNQYILHSGHGAVYWADETTGIIYLSMSRPRWPYAVKVTPENKIANYPDAMRRDAAAWDPLNATMVDGEMLGYFYDGQEGYLQKTIHAVKIGNEKDGFETLWQPGDPIAPLPDGYEVITIPMTTPTP